jgi:hypothetical protein
MGKTECGGGGLGEATLPDFSLFLKRFEVGSRRKEGWRMRLIKFGQPLTKDFQHLTPGVRRPDPKAINQPGAGVEGKNWNAQERG